MTENISLVQNPNAIFNHGDIPFFAERFASIFEMSMILKNQLRLGLTLLLVSFVAIVSSGAQAQSAKPAYLQGMQAVIAGGTTPESTTPAKVEGLKQLGTRRLRLINVDIGNLKAIAADGTQTVQWPVTLTYNLKLCRENQWIPHIIIGHVLPAPLAKVDAAGRKYGPTSWAAYDQYINTFLKYVVVDQGFSETEWEIGNEMSIPEQNWAASAMPKSGTDPAGFGAYSTLYTHIAQDVVAFRRQHPGTTLRVGAPDSGGDWALQFADFVTKNHVAADFVSMHVYGNSSNGANIENIITATRAKLASAHSRANFAITEWGASFESTPGLNYEPIAGAFALDFVAKMALFGVHDTMFLSLSQLPNSSWPAFYKLDGSPSHIMLALLAVAGLKGTPASCVGDADTSCVAAKDSAGKVEVVFWNYNWMTDKFPKTMPAKKAVTHTFILTPVEGNWASSYDLASAKMNSAPWQGGSPTSFARSGQPGLTFSLVVPYGNYGQFSFKPH
jgi:hypothetical protein